MCCSFSTSRPEQFSYNREEYNTSISAFSSDMSMFSSDTSMSSSDTSAPTNVEFIHYYDVRNMGPGILPYASLSLHIPASYKGVHIVQVDCVQVRTELPISILCLHSAKSLARSMLFYSRNCRQQN